MSFSMLKFESTSRKKYLKNKKKKRFEESFKLNRQFGGSNSQLHKKMRKVPVGGGCWLGELPVGGQNLTPGRTIFFVGGKKFFFVGGKNLNSFSALNEL